MDNTPTEFMEKENNYKPISWKDWALRCAPAQYKTPKSHLFLWPYTESYFNPIASCFLSTIDKISLMDSSRQWIARDGGIDLEQFFKKFPSPKDIKFNLLIDHRFAKLVPQAWGQYVQFFKIIQSVPSQSKRNKILVVGPIDNFVQAKTKLQQSLKLLKKKLNKNKWKDLKKLSFVMTTRKLPSHNFLTDYQPVRWQDMQSFLDLSECYVIDLTSPNLVGDSFLKHYILARKGLIINLRNSAKKKYQIALSPYHGMRIARQPF